MSDAVRAQDLPRGRRAPALGAVRSAVRRDVAALLADPGAEPSGAKRPGSERPGAEHLGAPALVLVALSGGADSLALAAATGAEAAASRRRADARPGGGGTPRRPPPFRAGAVVVDHEWSPGSAQVAATAAQAARDLGLEPVEVVVAGGHDGDGRPAGPRDAAAGGQGPHREAHARALRYAALEEVRARHGAVAVLVGHTADDQAEQVLLGLARGSGARSLAGMAAVRGALRRPLLNLLRETTEAACREAGLSPWSDPSNADPAHARARTRHRVLPVLEAELGPGVAAALVRSADQLREDADALDALARELVAGAVTAVERGVDAGAGGREVVVDVAALRGAPAALVTRTLRSAAVLAGASASELTRGHVLALVGLLDGPQGRGPVHLPSMIGARRRCGTLRLWTRATWEPTSPRSS